MDEALRLRRVEEGPGSKEDPSNKKCQLTKSVEENTPRLILSILLDAVHEIAPKNLTKSTFKWKPHYYSGTSPSKSTNMTSPAPPHG